MMKAIFGTILSLYLLGCSSGSYSIVQARDTSDVPTGGVCDASTKLRKQTRPDGTSTCVKELCTTNLFGKCWGGEIEKQNVDGTAALGDVVVVVVYRGESTPPLVKMDLNSQRAMEMMGSLIQVGTDLALKRAGFLSP